MAASADPRDARRILRSLIPSVYLPTALEMGAQFSIYPVLPLIALQLGFGVTGAAAVSAINGALSLVGPLPAARLLSAIGARTALIASGALSVAVAAAALWVIGGGIAGEADTAHRIALVAAMLLIAAVQQVWVLGRQAYLGIELPAPLRARGMTLLGGMLRIGQVIGPLLGAAVIAIGGLAWVYGLFAVLSAAATLCVALAMEPAREGRAPAPTAHPSTRKRTSSHRRLDAMVGRRMLVVTLGVAPIQMARVGRPVVVPLVAAVLGVDAAMVSIVFGVAAAVEILMVLPAGTVMQRRGRVVSVVCCAMLQAAGFLMLGIAVLVLAPLGAGAALAVLAVPSALMAVGNGFGSGLMMTLGVDLSPLVERTRYLSWWNTLLGAGQLASPLVVSAMTVVAPVAWSAVVLGGLLAVGGAWAARTMPGLVPGPEQELGREGGGARL